MDINPQTVGNEGQGENYKFGKMFWKYGKKFISCHHPKETLHWQPTQEIFTHKKRWFGVRHCVLQPSPLNTCWGRQNGPFRRACLLARSHRSGCGPKHLKYLQFSRWPWWLASSSFPTSETCPLAAGNTIRTSKRLAVGNAGSRKGLGIPSKFIKVNFDTTASRLKEKHGSQCQHLSTAWHSRILTHKKPLRGRKKKANKGHCKAHGCHGPVLTGIKGLWWLVWCNGLIQLICVVSWQDSTV